MRSASYAHMPSVPLAPPRWRRRSGIGTALARAAVSLMGTTCPGQVPGRVEGALGWVPHLSGAQQ
eukprot:4299662-Pleurochrysis_carterae.AAC.1